MRLAIAALLIAALLSGCAGTPTSASATRSEAPATPITPAATQEPSPAPTPEGKRVTREINAIRFADLSGSTPNYRFTDENGQEVDMPVDAGDWFLNMKLIETILPEGQGISLDTSIDGKIQLFLAEGSHLMLTVEVDGEPYIIGAGPGTTFYANETPEGLVVEIGEYWITQ